MTTKPSEFKDQASKEEFMESLYEAIKQLKGVIKTYESSQSPDLHSQLSQKVKIIRDGIEKLRAAGGITDYTLLDLESALKTQVDHIKPPIVQTKPPVIQHAENEGEKMAFNRVNRRAFEQELERSLPRMPGNLSAEQKEQLKGLFLQWIQDPTDMQMLLNIPGQAMDWYHRRAFDLYSSGQYRLAVSGYLTLCRLDPKNPDYFKGAAACFIRQELYEPAAIAYAMAMGCLAAAGIKDPATYLSYAACQQKLGLWKECKQTLRHIIDVEAKDEQFANFVIGAQKELQQLEKEHPGL